MAVNVLIISDQQDFARLIAHHLSTFWDGSQITVHKPEERGRFHEAFIGAGYDVVVLDEECDGGLGGNWLSVLGARAEFPPIVFFANDFSDERAAAMRQLGALVCLSRSRIDNRRFASAMREAESLSKNHDKQLLSRKELERRYRFGEVTIRGHRFIKELGAGGTSRVYLAESEKAREIVVLKVLTHNPDTADSPEGYDRFLQEYQLLSQVRHPNVVKIHDFGVADDHAFIVMEYFPAGDLRKRMSQPISVTQALGYVEQIARALSAVHGVGILHRDLKPGNIMLRDDGSLALIDFGVAKQLSRNTDITAAGAIFGTPYYMSPEQGHGEPVDERSDLYSLGIMFFELLTNKRPYSSDSVMNVIYMHRHSPLPSLPRELSWIESTVHRMIAKEPPQRFQSAAEVVAALGLLRLMALTAP